MNRFSRRDLLRFGVAAPALMFPNGSTSAYAQLLAPAATFNDYRALVCVFLFGGNDSFNMLVPRSDAEYGVYAASRQNLAVAQNTLLPITPLNPDGREYGLHPSMAALQPLFANERLALVTNMGPLIEPTTKAQYFNRSVRLPPQLFSHNDQQDQWHSLKGQNASRSGWAGRIADALRTQVAQQQLATNVSLFGNSLFQSGDETRAYVMGPTGPVRFEGFAADFPQQRQAFAAIIAANQATVYERAFADVQQRALQTADAINDALDNAPVLGTAFPNSSLGQQLATVARLIAIREQLNMERQIFFVATGGFDTHDDQLQAQPNLLGGIANSLAAFYAATTELGVANAVTTFTQSDFARTLTSNGDGTDHAWGGVQMVLGDAVLGRRLIGTYPLLSIGGADDVGGGRMIPTVSADQYAATLARWLGVAEGDIARVAPNAVNFPSSDLGIFG